MISTQQQCKSIQTIIAIESDCSTFHAVKTSTQGHNSVINLWKMTGTNPNLDLANINAFIKFGQIISLSSKEIKQKWISDTNLGI